MILIKRILIKKKVCTSVGRRVAITILFSVAIRFDNPFEIPAGNLRLYSGYIGSKGEFVY